MWENALLFLYLDILFPDNNWFNPPWGWYLWNSAIFILVKFQMLMCFLLNYLQFLKSSVTPTILISSCFKILLSGKLKLRNTYILPPRWCIYLFPPFIVFYFECLCWGKYSFLFCSNLLLLFCCEKPGRFIGLYRDPTMRTPSW